MAIDGYLSIPGIEGEAEHKDHEDEIEVHSVSWQIAQPAPAGAAVRGRGKTEVSPFEFGKFYDRSSPALAQAVADGTHYRTAVFTATRPGTVQTNDFLTFELTNVQVIRYQLGTKDDRLAEIVSLWAQKIEIVYKHISANGRSIKDYDALIAL